jgi:hypothetical protein
MLFARALENVSPSGPLQVDRRAPLLPVRSLVTFSTRQRRARDRRATLYAQLNRSGPYTVTIGKTAICGFSLHRCRPPAAPHSYYYF